MTPNRRDVLVALGAGLATAGCIDGASPGGPSTDDPGGNGTTDSPTDTASPTDTERPTDTPDEEDRFADEPCPSFTETDRTVCAHTRPADAPVWLDASAQVFEPVSGNDAVETIAFRLHNESGEVFTLNPYAWAVKRRVDGEWRHVAPDAHVEPLVEVPDGERYTWILSRETHPTPNAERTLYPVVDVEHGLHAFAVDGWTGGANASESARTTVELVALFDVKPIVVDPRPTTTTDG